ncbi:MAG: hypothetical protein JWO58_353 [Chitinophagaceae bacterium]|nr:hypothetical protein [Chitinophagaceae bacterium]
MKKKQLKPMKNKPLYFLLLFCLAFTHGIVAQTLPEKCATMQVQEFYDLQHPARKVQRALFEQKIQQHILAQKSRQNRTTSGTIYTIPVVVHVIHNVSSGAITGTNISDQQITSQIAVLNEDYRRLNADASNTPSMYQPVAADVEFQFCLAVRNPAGDPTTGINRIYNPQAKYEAITDDVLIKSQSYWPSDQYLNIWVCDLDNGVLGYAHFPSDASDNEGNAETDGVVIDYAAFGRNYSSSSKYNLGRTATHEIGHWFNLIHIWGDESDCSGDDFCADIPPCSDLYYAAKPSCVAPFQCSNWRMIQNYMDYSDDACMNMFTADQRDRMHAAMNTAPRRISIQTSLGCCTNCYVPHANFIASKTTNVYAGETITFTDQSTGNIDTYQWDFGSGAVPATATGAGPQQVMYSTPGLKDVTLIAISAYGKDTITKVSYINVILPTADFVASKTSNVQLNEKITFTDLSSGPIDTYNWDFGTDAVPATATGIGPHQVKYTSAGLKTVTLNTTSPYSADTNTKTNYISVVLTPPTADFFASKTRGVVLNENIVFTDSSIGDIDTYDWDFGTGAIPPTASGIGPHTVSYSNTGYKDVTLSVSGTQGANSLTKTNYILVVNETTSELNVYPNPGKDLVTLNMLFTDLTNIHLLICDRIGRTLLDVERSDVITYNEVINVSQWADGLYIIKLLKDNTKLATYKLDVFK